ncbi:L-type lectin-domain containing receptor kinase I.7, partial [Mucuna pruriens]
MAPFATSHYFRAFTFSILFLKTLAFDPVPLFSIADFGKDLKFKSNLALFGNAKVVNGGSGIGFSGSGSSGTGRVLYKKPIKLFQGKPRQLVSFSTYFSFSISVDNGGGLAFVMAPKGPEGDAFYQSSSGLNDKKLEVIGVEFSATKGGRNGVSTICNVGGSVVAKISNHLTTSGEKLHAWIDYQASSRRLEVRLSQHGKSRPSDPLLWHSIDLSNVLKEDEMLVGFSSVKGNDSQACFLHSWSFVLRNFPHSVHSEPLDPKVFVKNTETPVVKQRSDCFLRVLAAMIFGTGCGALTAFIVLYLWTIFGNKRAVVPEESVMQPVDVEYRKVKIVVDKTIEDVKSRKAKQEKRKIPAGECLIRRLRQVTHNRSCSILFTHLADTLHPPPRKWHLRTPPPRKWLGTADSSPPPPPRCPPPRKWHLGTADSLRELHLIHPSSPVYQCKKAFLLNMAVNCSLTLQNIS